MHEYADYFADLPGGSAIGRAVEPKPFDANRIEGGASILRSSEAIAAPVPMPIKGRDLRIMNLMARRPLRAFPTIMQRGIQGTGGKQVRKEKVAGEKEVAAGLTDGARRAGVDSGMHRQIKEAV